MIGISVRDLAYLKTLQPIMLELQARKVDYILYYMDIPRGSKEYNRASLNSIKKSSAKIISGAKLIRSFNSNNDLFNKLVLDGIKKFISLEIGLSMKHSIGQIKSKGIRMYSIQNLTDTIWQSDPSFINSMERVYYPSIHTMRSHHEFAEIKYNSDRDKIASPLYDILDDTFKKNTLVLLPNLVIDQVNPSFGSANNFFKIIENLSKSSSLIFKTRKKQWLPEQIKQYAQEIVYDGSDMYPSALSKVLGKVDTVVMFYSSGLYECVYADKYVINIELPVNKRWRWKKEHMFKYFSKDEGSLYNYSGVVETVEQSKAMDSSWVIENKLNPYARETWLRSYVGELPNNNTVFIVNDVISS